jgi:hypothetical protein
MAMAKLCSQVKYARKLNKHLGYKLFHAFIVDHGVRPNSAKEAIRVGQELVSWGI